MYLVHASFNPQLIKGDILQNCKGLIASIKINHVLVEQSFHSMFQGDEDLGQHTLQPGDFIYGKDNPRKTLFNLTRKAPISH